MKLTKRINMTVCAVVFCIGAVTVQGQETLKRDQWFKLIGESAKDKAVLKTTLAQIESNDCLEFTRRVLRAVTKMPLGQDEKAARYIESSILCFANAKEGAKLDVVAETIALAPVAYLPGLVKEMSKGFDPKASGMTNEQYKEYAEKGVEICFKRNAHVDDTTVRNTFAILLFTRSAQSVPGLQDALLAKLPDDRSRGLAAKWLADAARDDYAAVLASADVQVEPPMPAINLVGLAQVERLLAYMEMSGSAFEALMVSGTGSSASSIDIQIDSGFQQTPLVAKPLPVGYQNQGMNLRRPCWCP